jgi:hypothetical protein
LNGFEPLGGSIGECTEVASANLAALGDFKLGLVGVIVTVGMLSLLNCGGGGKVEDMLNTIVELI